MNTTPKTSNSETRDVIVPPLLQNNYERTTTRYVERKVVNLTNWKISFDGNTDIRAF